jgi:hypothetical protein
VGTLFTGNAEQYGDRKFNSGGSYFFASVDHSLCIGSFVDSFQGNVVTGFKAHVRNFKSVFPKFSEFVHAFSSDAFGVGVCSYSGYPWKFFLDGNKNSNKPFLGDDKCITVAEKETILVTAVGRSEFDIGHNDIVTFY